MGDCWLYEWEPEAFYTYSPMQALKGWPQREELPWKDQQTLKLFLFANV